MKLTLCVLVFVAGCAAQTTTFVPKSACGYAARTCYDLQQAVMNSKFDALDFAGACQIYKTILSCMTDSGNCASDFDFMVVRQGLIDDQDGICGVDGSIQSCGVDVQVCFTEMDAAVSDAMSKNLSQACPLITKFIACVKQVNNAYECSTNMVNKLNHVVQLFGTDQQIMGCNGPCAQAIAVCTVNAITLPTNASLLSPNIARFCNSAFKVFSCLNSSVTASACASSPESHLKDLAQLQLTKVGDICSKDGSTTPCVSDFTQCATDLIGIGNTTNATTHCRVAAEFLECISKLPCTTTLAPLVANFRNQFETAEIEQKCPSVGSCNDRFAKCGEQDQGLGYVNDSNRDAMCAKVITGLSCFDYVKNDPYCINEYNSFITEEQDLKRLILIRCGGLYLTTSRYESTTGSSEALRYVHPLLFVVALLASLQQ